MIYLIIYLVGCVVACYIVITMCLKETDLLVEDLPIVITFTVTSWITIVFICFHCLYKYISTNINGDKVLIKRKNI